MPILAAGIIPHGQGLYPHRKIPELDGAILLALIANTGLDFDERDVQEENGQLDSSALVEECSRERAPSGSAWATYAERASSPPSLLGAAGSAAPRC